MVIKSAAPVGDLIAERLGVGEHGTLSNFREGMGRLGAAMEAVELICPEAVSSAGWALHDAAQALIDPTDDSSDVQEKFTAYGAARARFVKMARNDLVPKSLWQRRP